MAILFCKECGTRLTPDSLFCSGCGKRVGYEDDVQEAQKCNGSVNIDKQVQEKKDNEPAGIKNDADHSNGKLKESLNIAKKLLGSTQDAAPVGGEMIFTYSLPASGKVLAETGPFKYLYGGVARLLRGFAGVFKDKKKLVPAAVITAVWLVLILLPVFGVNSNPVRYIRYLTFAGGGIGTGISGAVGGAVGKGIYAYFVTAVILPVFSGKKPLKGTGGGLKTFFGSIAVGEKKNLAFLLMGIGLSLIVYNFLTGNASFNNSMIGFVAMFLSIRALSRKTGFIHGFLASFGSKKGKVIDAALINRFISGMALGFALSVPASLISLGLICYMAGTAVLFAAVVVLIVPGGRKEAAVN